MPTKKFESLPVYTNKNNETNAKSILLHRRFQKELYETVTQDGSTVYIYTVDSKP